MADRNAKKKLGPVEKFLFASGDLYGGGAQIVISFYYLVFLTDVVGLRPALAGTVVLVSKIWDAVSDPLMGIITDNTRTRYGRRRPYFLAGFFGIIASFFLLWYPIGSGGQLARFAFVLFTYLFYSTMQTMVMVPYSAMSSEISEDFTERSSVNGLRLFLSQLSTLLCAVIPMEIVKLMPDTGTGYIAMSVVFAIFFAVPYLFMFFFTRERVPYRPEVKSSFSMETFLEPFRVRSFRCLLGIYMCSFLAMDIVSTVIVYFMNYYIKRPGESNYVLGVMLVVQTVLVPVTVRISGRIGKAKTVKTSLAFWAAGILLFAFLTPSSPVWAVYVIAAVMGFGVVGCVVMAWTMYPDVTDAGELAFGRRSAGSFSGVMTFMRKFSAAIGIFIVSNILEYAGYVKPVQEIVDGTTVNVLQDQGAGVITALRIIAVALPLVLIVFTYVFASRYPLTRPLYEKLSVQLKFARGETAVGLDDEELKNLEKTLI